MASTAAARIREWLAVCFGKRSRNLISVSRPRCPTSCRVPPPTPGTDVLKIHLFNTTDSRPSNQSDQHREQVRRRQTLTVIFAILLISIAGVSSAQSPQPAGPDSSVMLQYDGATSAPIAHPDAVVDAARVAGGAVQLTRLTGDARPTYVDMNAALANWDSDADPDGWRADIVLFDRKDRPVAMRAQAKFELVIRVSTAEHLRFVNADIPPIRWSIPLEFDEDAVARVKLPLHKKLRPVFGWSSALYRPSTRRPATISRNHGNYIRGPGGWSRPRTFVSQDLRTLAGVPSTGELRVKVSVPTEGVFEAATPIWLRPSGLVDTRWPYR